MLVASITHYRPLQYGGFVGISEAHSSDEHFLSRSDLSSRLLVHLLLLGYCLPSALLCSRFMLFYIHSSAKTPRSWCFARKYTSSHPSYRLESCRFNMSLAPEARQSLSAAACWMCTFCSGFFDTMSIVV